MLLFLLSTMLKTRSLFESYAGCSPSLRVLRRRVANNPFYFTKRNTRAFSFQKQQQQQQQQQSLATSARRHGKIRWNSNSTAPPGAPAAAAANEKIPEPSFRDLKQIVFNQSIPFIGFGFLDNAILIIAGDAIDNSLGVYLGISTLCAAAIGNIISDLAGLGLGTVIEDFCANVLKLPVPNITAAQRTLRSVRMSSNLGMAIGMTIGCVIGMFPLFFIDSHKAEHLKQKSHLEALFQDVVTEAKTLIGAESTCLYLRVHVEDDDNNITANKGGELIQSAEDDKKSSNNNWLGINWGKSGNFLFSSSSQQRYQPTVDGDHLYAMYLDGNNNSVASASSIAAPKEDYSSKNGATDKKEGAAPGVSRFLPIGKGIVSRAVLTGEAWNIPDVRKEPDVLLDDLYEEDGSVPEHLKNMVVVPVLDGQGRTIAVIRALNKIPDANRQSGGKPAETGTIAAARGMLVRAATRRIVTPPPEGFTDADVQILKSLASHVSVSLQRLFRDEEHEEMRLRDTIRILKEHGLEGIADESAGKTFERRPSLFPR